MKIIYYLTIIILSCCITAVAHAQYSFYGTINLTANIQTVMVLSITNNSSSSITFSSGTQLASGYNILDFYSVAIKANVSWRLSVATTTAYFGASGTYSSSNMPASIVKLTVAGKSAGIQLSTTSQLLSSGTRGDNSDTGNSFNVDFNANPGYNYGPGIYTLTINYTLTAQ